MGNSITQFWDAVDRTFALARDGKKNDARAQIRVSLQARQAALRRQWHGCWCRTMKVKNRWQDVSEGSTIACSGKSTSFCRNPHRNIAYQPYGIYSNRRLFAKRCLSEQRSELAQKLISTQESTLLYISRELHDEFVKILTAIGSMLSRARNDVPKACRCALN